MIQRISVDLPKIKTIPIELDEALAPKTIHSLLKCLPISTSVHIWGEELYSDPTSIVAYAENQSSLVDLMDVAYWPAGKAICLFFGPTPLGKKGEIRPYSPVNVIGKIIDTDKNFLKSIQDGSRAIFRLSQ